MDTHSDAPSDAVPESRPVAEAAPAAPSLTRLLYWSVRREFWENRSLYIAPLALAAVVLFSFLVGTIGLPARLRAAAALDAAQQQAKLATPFSMAASVIILLSYVVGAFYCLEALYGERRDRSILFWKSLPVSDLTTVLAKASIPLVVLPLFVFAIVTATQLVMLLLATLVALLNGLSPAPLWTRVPLFRMSLVLVYGLVVHALWHAPLYAWLLMVSAWARRLPILWAVLPPLAIGAFGRMLGSSSFCDRVRYRLIGTLELAFDFKAGGHIVPVLEPVRFLSSPGLWGGLLFAAAFIAVAVRLRRNREPI
jgi:ABC-2 type transport system permease protein